MNRLKAELQKVLKGRGLGQSTCTPPRLQFRRRRALATASKLRDAPYPSSANKKSSVDSRAIRGSPAARDNQFCSHVAMRGVDGVLPGTATQRRGYTLAERIDSLCSRLSASRRGPRLPSTATQRRGYNASEPHRCSHLLFALGRSGNKIAVWPMTISQRAGVTGTSGGG